MRKKPIPPTKSDQIPDDIARFENHRLINKDGSFNIERIGTNYNSPYQNLVEMSWGRFLFLVLAVYILVNSIFAILFYLAGYEHLTGVPQTDKILEQLVNTFFFSVQTFTTVGYGSMAPIGISTNIIASLDALCGLLSLALATGLVFARFSKPKNPFLFSKNALIAPYKDGWSFQMRLANKRNNRIIDLNATLLMTWLEQDGTEMMRKFERIPLELDNISVFPLNWTLVHTIDNQSPLNNCDQNALKHKHAEFLVMIEGHDETYAQKVHGTASYHYEEVKWYYKFVRMYQPLATKGTVLDLSKINEIESVEFPA